MPINNISSDIGFEGITIGGIPFGGTRQAGGSVVGSNVGIEEIVLIARQVQRTATISSGANSSIPLPVSFGKQKFIISVDGKSYCPGVDFVPNASGATWINTNLSIPTSSSMVVWGPANDYTADLLTIESINMNSGKFNAGSQTIQLDGNGGYNADGNDSIYLIVNGFTAIPSDYAVGGNGLISWNGTTLTTSDTVFAYYYNKAVSQPYRLPVAQTRLSFSPSAAQTQFSLSALPRAVNAGAAQMVVDSVRQVYGKDFSIEYPKLKWFGSAFTGSEYIDLSYIRDVSYLPNIFSDTLVNTSITPGPGGTLQIPISNAPIKPELGLFTINGDLMVGDIYSKITMNGSNIFSPEFIRTGNNINYNPEARLPRFDLGVDDELVYSGFLDASSASGLKIEYFQGYSSGGGSVKTLQHTPADTSKVIVWASGRAYFTLHKPLDQPEVVVSGNQVQLTPLLDELPADPLMDIVILYFTDASLAAQWKLELLSFVPSTWDLGATIGNLSKPVSAVGNTFLFTNGQREKPENYQAVNNGYSLKNLSLPGDVYNDDQLVLFWL